MNFALSDEQQMLQSSANDFVKRESDLKRIRELREDSTGFSKVLWGKMAELGWLGIPFAEDVGGLGQGIVDMIVVMVLPNMSSRYCNLLGSISRIVTLAPKPTAILAALIPTIPPPIIVTFPLLTPGTPPRSTPFPPIFF